MGTDTSGQRGYYHGLTDKTHRVPRGKPRNHLHPVGVTCLTPGKRWSSQCATGSGWRSVTGVPVNVDPVVPVNSTLRYCPIIDSGPGTSTVLKSRVRDWRSSPRRAVRSTSTSRRWPSRPRFRCREFDRTRVISRASLSVAGKDGTLKNRLKDLPPNTMIGKTGYIGSVRSLSGFVKTRSGDELVISIIYNGFKGSVKPYEELQDEVVRTLVDWPNISSSK